MIAAGVYRPAGARAPGTAPEQVVDLRVRVSRRPGTGANERGPTRQKHAQQGPPRVEVTPENDRYAGFESRDQFADAPVLTKRAMTDMRAVDRYDVEAPALEREGGDDECAAHLFTWQARQRLHT
jgi:hypothetical protein